MTLLLSIFEHVLTPLLTMSLTAAFVAVVVLLLRLLLKQRAPKQIICLLWLVVFARLLIPITFETSFSLVPAELHELVPGQVESVENPPASSPQSTTAPGSVVETPVQTPSTQLPINPAPTVTTPPAVTLTPQNPNTPAPMTPENPTEAPQSTVPAVPLWLYIVPAVWMVGVLAMLIYGVFSFLLLHRRVYNAIRTEDGVWEHPSLASPFILGLFRPRIYLPMGIEGQARQFILHHERAHLRRCDYIIKPFCWLALAIHWFNPLAWVAFLLMSRDIETACDESVIRKLGSEIKADYSATLLALATDKRFPAPSPLSFGEGDAKARIKSVLKFKKPALWVSIIAVVVVIAAAVCLLTNQSPRGLDSFYPLADWEAAETVTAYFPKNEFPKDPEKVELSAEAAAEMTEVFHKYKYWRELSHLIPDNRIGWYDSLWKVCYQFENGSEITLNYSGSGTLVVYHHSGLFPDGSAVNRRDRHYAVNGAEQLTAEILSIIMREFELASAEPNLFDYTTMDAYPGLYFLEEPSSTVGTKITAYKLIDGELVLVGGYDEHMANNFSGLIGSNGEEQHMFASPDEVYAMFEELLAAACRELDPNWTPLPAVGERFLSALNDEVEIVDPGLGMTGTLSELVEATAPTVEMKITKMAAVDLDSDGIKELLLLLETPSTVHGTMILRCTGAGSQIYGYELWARAFNDIKTDGTFSFSGGVSDGGFGRISFTSGGYEVERITYSESTYPDSTVAYYVNKQPATRDEFLAACHNWQNTPGVIWVEYTPENAELLLRGQGEGQENPPDSFDFLSSLPTEIVTPDTLPSDPEEYYLVAALPESHVYLYAKNHGEDSLLLWNGNFWWPLKGRIAHTPRMNLPRLYLMDENAQSTTVAAISERASGTEVSVEQLVVYVMGEHQVDSSYYTGLRQSIYDWSSIHEAFNSKKNTLVYDADTNSFTVFWNGRVYNSGELPQDMGQWLALEDGYTGSLFASGNIIKYAYVGGNRFTVTVLTAIEDWPLSPGVTGLDLTWTVEFNGEGFDLVGEISLGSGAEVNQIPPAAESENGVAELPDGWKLNDFTVAGFDKDGLGDFGYRAVLSEDELRSLPDLLDLSEWQELVNPPEYGLTVCLALSDSDAERFLYVLDGADGKAVIKLMDQDAGESFVYLASEECVAYAKALAVVLKDRAT